MIKQSDLLQVIPDCLKNPLFEEFNGLHKAYYEGRWKLASLDAGRFCEVVYTILDGVLSGAFAAAPSKPNNFPASCKALESKQPIGVGDHSIRILIPRVLPGMYDVRNNRNVGHVGGDVTSNKIDATMLLGNAIWILAELIRVFHNIPLHEAQAIVDSLADLKPSIIWEFDGNLRVMSPDMSMTDKTLILLNSINGWCPVLDLERWVKAARNYRQNVLQKLDDKLLIEYDSKNLRAAITPLGTKRSEEIIHLLQQKNKT